MDEKGLGKRVQLARRQAGLTQQQLCGQANLSYSTLAKIERGAIKSPSIFTIQSIAGALNLSLDELVGVAHPGSTKRVSKSGIRFVYFDLNDCLIRFHTSGFTELAQESGQPVDVVESVYWKYDNQICRGDTPLETLNAAWKERLGIEVDWTQYYLKAVDKMPGMEELITWASEQYQVGIMSNSMPGFINGVREKGLIPSLPYDAIIDSSVTHLLKPDPKAYEIAQTQSGVSPNELLLIDDNRANLIAAEQMGWHTIWFNAYQPEESIASVKSALEPA